MKKRRYHETAKSYKARKKRERRQRGLRKLLAAMRNPRRLLKELRKREGQARVWLFRRTAAPSFVDFPSMAAEHAKWEPQLTYPYFPQGIMVNN